MASTSSKNAINHLLKCFGERDLQGILSDYAPGAVLFTPNGSLQGVDAIRALFQATTVAADLFGDPRQAGAFRIAKKKSSLDLVAQDPVLCGQILYW